MLTPFLESIKDDIPIGVREVERISLLLRGTGPWTVERLKDTLLALLVKDHDSQAKFLRRFEAFFPEDAQNNAEISLSDAEIARVLANLETLVQSPRFPDPADRLDRDHPRRAGHGKHSPSVPSRSALRFRIGAIAAGIVLLACLGVGLFHLFAPTPESELAQPTESTRPPPAVEPDPVDDANIPIEPRPAQRLYRNMPYVDKIEYYPLPTPSRAWMAYSAIALLFLLAAMGHGIYLHRSRKVPEDEPAGFDPNAPRHFSLATIGGPRAPMLDDDLLDHLADSMGYFQSEQPGRILDVAASIDATVENLGIPRIVFARRRQVRALLVLEDGFAEATAWNTVATELAQGMVRRGVPVIHGRYEGIPDRFRLDDGAQYHLEDLEDQRQGILVLVFADQAPAPGTDGDFSLERLARWPMVAWINYEGSYWIPGCWVR
ncbi:MAG: hypothetical protein HKP13_06220, partial [Gammaproteobacteria bacterium]|nr:hypothetical protein [Gammaproteobacteria bacterium]